MKIKIRIPKLKFSPKYLYALSAITIITVLLALGIFLYKNLYQSITQSEQIIVLKQEVAPDIIDMNKFNNVLDKLSEKINPEKIEWQHLKNPFIPSAINVINTGLEEVTPEINEPTIAEIEGQDNVTQ
jgi:hypothetical protein